MGVQSQRRSFSSINMHQKHRSIVRPKNFSGTALLQNCKEQRAIRSSFFSALWQPQRFLSNVKAQIQTLYHSEKNPCISNLENVKFLCGSSACKMLKMKGQKIAQASEFWQAGITKAKQFLQAFFNFKFLRPKYRSDPQPVSLEACQILTKLL